MLRFCNNATTDRFGFRYLKMKFHRCYRLFGTAAFGLTGLTGLTSAVAQAETYRCTEHGKVIFSDRVCGDNAEPINVKPASGEQAALRSREATQSGYPLHEPRSARRMKPGAPSTTIPGAAPAAPPPMYSENSASNGQRAQEQQARRVECIANTYNAWVVTQHPRPSPDAVEAGITDARRLCRQRFP